MWDATERLPTFASARIDTPGRSLKLPEHSKFEGIRSQPCLVDFHLLACPASREAHCR